MYLFLDSLNKTFFLFCTQIQSDIFKRGNTKNIKEIAGAVSTLRHSKSQRKESKKRIK